MADYFAHWMSFAQRTDRAKLPKIYFVNWFRKSPEDKWLWPGYGDNSRVLAWVCERVEGTGKAVKTEIGNLPTPDALNLSGLNMPAEDLKMLLSVDKEGWKKEAADIATYYQTYGDKLPAALKQELASLNQRLG